MYAIIGITGQVGRVTANLLLEKKLPVRAVVRDPAKGAEWKNSGAEVAIAELHDANALQAAFHNTDHNRMLHALVTAINKAKPKKVVYLSSVGAHLSGGTGAIKKLYDMEQAFSKLTMPTASIRAAWFMENFAGNISYAKETGKLPSFLNPPDLPVEMIAAKDIGKRAALLLEENWSGHRTIELAGPCKYSANDVAYVLSYQLNRPVSADIIPAEQYVASYQSFGFTPAAAKMMAEMNNGFNSGHIVFEQAGQEQVRENTLLEDALNSFI